ncbi:MAG: ABC transporter ATP-binding protein, partial [Armatimonadetes bacterium]|nr:ABC transporter ATP-binding protein [Armatimonadota bacterium]
MASSWKTQRDLLATYLRPHWRGVVFLSVLLLGSIALQLAAPQVVRHFIDRVQRAAPGPLVEVALLFLAVVLTAQVTGALSVYASERLSWAATNSLRADLALHVLRLDMAFHTARSPGELVERVDGDVTQLSAFLSQLVIRIAGNVLLLAGILVLLSREDWRVGLAYTLFTVVALVALRRLLEVAVPHWKEARQAGAVLLGFLEERLAGTEDIRSSGAVPYVLRRLTQIMRHQLQTSRRAWFLGHLMWATTVALVALGNALAFGFGAYLLRGGAITIGTVYLFFHYTEMLRRPLEQITRQMQELQRASASASRISDLFALRPAPEQPGATLPPGALGVEFRNVTFGYEPDEPVLADLSFRLESGRILGLLGRTGSGKTTVGRLLSRLYDPAQGATRL